MIPVTADSRTMVIYEKDAPKIAIMIEEDEDAEAEAEQARLEATGCDGNDTQTTPLRRAQQRIHRLQQCPGCWPIYKLHIRLGSSLMVPLHVTMWTIYAPPLAILFIPLGALQLAAAHYGSSTLMVPYLIFTCMSLAFYVLLATIMFATSTGVFPVTIAEWTAEYLGCVAARELVFLVVVIYSLACSIRCYRYIITSNFCSKYAPQRLA